MNTILVIFRVRGENSVSTKQDQDAQKSTNHLTLKCGIILLADSKIGGGEWWKR